MSETMNLVGADRPVYIEIKRMKTIAQGNMSMDIKKKTNAPVVTPSQVKGNNAAGPASSSSMATTENSDEMVDTGKKGPGDTGASNHSDGTVVIASSTTSSRAGKNGGMENTENAD
jgi:hypothetical protein